MQRAEVTPSQPLTGFQPTMRSLVTDPNNRRWEQALDETAGFAAGRSRNQFRCQDNTRGPRGRSRRLGRTLPFGEGASEAIREDCSTWNISGLGRLDELTPYRRAPGMEIPLIIQSRRAPHPRAPEGEPAVRLFHVEQSDTLRRVGFETGGHWNSSDSIRSGSLVPGQEVTGSFRPCDRFRRSNSHGHGLAISCREQDSWNHRLGRFCPATNVGKPGTEPRDQSRWDDLTEGEQGHNHGGGWCGLPKMTRPGSARHDVTTLSAREFFQDSGSAKKAPSAGSLLTWTLPQRCSRVHPEVADIARC